MKTQPLQAAGRLARLSLLLGQILLVACVLSGGLIAAGWALEDASLKRLWLAPNAIPSSTALGVLLFGIAGLLNSFATNSKWRWWAGKFMAPVLIVSAIATLIESTLGLDLSLAVPLGPQPEDSRGLTFPGPMAPNVSVSLFLLACALSMPRFQLKGRMIGHYCALLTLLASVSALLGYAIGVEFMCTIFGCIKLPLLSSVMFGACSIAYMMIDPEVGFMSMFCSENQAGKVARRLALTSLVVPFALWARHAGVVAGLFDQHFGWFAFSASMVILFWRSIGIGTQGIADVDEAKKEVEKQLQESSAALQEIYRAKIAQTDGSIDKTAKRTKKICMTCASTYSAEERYCPTDNTELMEVRDDSLVGIVFADRYMITEFLGKGGMSSVYKAQHVYTNKVVAVKVLLPHLASDPTSIRRFQREAKSATLLKHPNLLEVFDFGLTLDGDAFIVMQFVEGISLADFINETGKIGLPPFLSVFSQVCAGLACAHEEGVIHRDLKPSNIMLKVTEDRTFAQIVDFGLAKLVDDQTAQKITATQDVLGSPLYMSPESYGDGSLTSATDVYSLGCVMYEALTGNPPLMADTLTETIMKQLHAVPKPLPPELNIPAEIDEIILRMLAKQAAERPTIVDVSQAIEKVAAAKTPSRT